MLGSGDHLRNVAAIAACQKRLMNELTTLDQLNCTVEAAYFAQAIDALRAIL